MTVPPLFGWEILLVVLVLLVAVAVAFFVAAAVGSSADSRAEWQAGLDARSSERRSTDGPPARSSASPHTGLRGSAHSGRQPAKP